MTHLWMAERFCDIYGVTDEDMLRDIIVGTELPDIRYITHRERELTHLPIKNLRECESAFEMGMVLHAWLDVVREAHITPEVYEEVALYSEGHDATLLKCIEEEILADLYDGRKWSYFFDSIHPQELPFASPNEVKKWHTIIKWSMSMRPSWLLWGQSYVRDAFGISADTLYRWSYLLVKLKKKPIFQNHLFSLLIHIEEEIKCSTLFKCNG